MSDPDAPTPPTDNQLGSSASLYLRQHAQQPVPWREWSPAVHAEAAQRDVPIFLSSGYSSCHWCHVMAHESFDDPEVGRILGQRFVCVKVDREERPDIDAACMDAVQAITGQGGWPLTCVMTPDGRPFWGGTYFPRRGRAEMPGILDVADAIQDVWSSDRGRIEDTATRLAVTIAQRNAAGMAAPIAFPETDPALAGAADDPIAAALAERVIDDPDTVRAGRVLSSAINETLARADLARGGFERAPKFPPPMPLELLLRSVAGHWDGEVPEITVTLDRMLWGGVYDQVGGGFHRYSTDGEWLVPHFEKMLYDNAQLLRVYALAHTITGEARYERAARETVTFLMRDMALPGGAFGSALDADMEGSEGLTYVWTREQLIDALGETDGARVSALLHADTPGGNFEGSNVLSLAGEPDAELWAWWTPLRERLLAEREARPQPAFDPKAVAAWNGLMLGALADAWIALGHGRMADPLLTAALELGAHLRDVQTDGDGVLRRTWHPGGSLGAPAFAEDLASVAWGFLRLSTATGDGSWFMLAQGLAERLASDFVDPVTGGLFSTSADGHPDALVRHVPTGDHPLPSGTSMAATVWAELARWYPQEPRWRELAIGAVRSVARGIERSPTHFAQGAIALDILVTPPRELVVVAPADTPLGQPLLNAVGHFLAERPYAQEPWLSIAYGREGDPHPGLADRLAVDGQTTAYLCSGMVCAAPTTDPAVVAAGLMGRRGLIPAGCVK